MVVIAVALKTRRTLEPLILGTVLAYVIVDGNSFISGWTDAFFTVASDRDHQWIFMVCALFGSLITLLGASYGSLGFSRLLRRFCRGPVTTQLITWVMGILIFVDDYLNIMTLSTSMKSQTDHLKIPRESLAYIIDSTGAPVCALLPFSTWAVFFSGLFYAESGIPELGYGGAMQTFYHIIPYTFYAIIAVILVPLFAMGLVPPLGKMRIAYARVRKTGAVYSPESASLNLEDDEDSPNIKGCYWDFILPLLTLIILAITTEELFDAMLASIAVCFILYVPRKKMSAAKFCDLAMMGFCNMIPTIAIIFFAFVMQQAMSEIKIADYVINVVSPFMTPEFFPCFFFSLLLFLISQPEAFGEFQPLPCPSLCL